MNPFFDISDKEDLPVESFALRNLGVQMALIIPGRKASEYWRTSGTPSKTIYRATTSEDYDQQFVSKLYNWKPVYNIDQILEHHYRYCQLEIIQRKDEFLKHLRYVILPVLKKIRNSEVHVELFEKWLDSKSVQNNNHFESTDVHIPKPGALSKTVHRIHFDDLSWSDFERLIFAYVKRLREWTKIDWLGQSGQDEGRDIWGRSHGKSYCYLCANYKALTLKKAKDDINKLIKADLVPDCLVVVCGGKVSAKTNENITSYATTIGIRDVEIWSGSDIEENLRLQAPDLVRRFFEGNNFPELESDSWDDARLVEELSNCFNRPAFTTRFHKEVNIPDFGKAITDTIEVLNTGLHRLRDGTLIKQIPSRHKLQDRHLRGRMTAVYELVVKLRDSFNELCKKKEIQSCGCGLPDCDVYFLSESACQIMDNIRLEIFSALRQVNPNLTLKFH